MKSASRKCFIEHFHLRSPVEEFECFSSETIERLRGEANGADVAAHQEATAIVLRKLRPNWGNKNNSPASG